MDNQRVMTLFPSIVQKGDMVSCALLQVEESMLQLRLRRDFEANDLII